AASEYDFSLAVVVGTVTGTAFVEDSVPSYTLRYYWVRAVGECGTGPVGMPDRGYADCRTPDAPTGLQAGKGENLDRIVLSWEANDFADWYEVFRADAGDFENAELIATTDDPAFVDVVYPSEATYTYWIRAASPCGPSAPSVPDTGFAE